MSRAASVSSAVRRGAPGPVTPLTVTRLTATSGESRSHRPAATSTTKIASAQRPALGRRGAPWTRGNAAARCIRCGVRHGLALPCPAVPPPSGPAGGDQRPAEAVDVAGAQDEQQVALAQQRTQDALGVLERRQ